MKLYMLKFTDIELSYENHSEDFLIGIFETEHQATGTANYYSANVKGFCQYPMTYSVIELPVVGDDGDIPKTVWLAEGWNVNGEADEIDVIQSDCFASKTAAEDNFNAMKNSYPEKEWVLNEFQIGKAEWCEGFVRLS